MQRTKPIAVAIGITALAIVGLDTYTYAGTGDSLILGKYNNAGKTTHVTSTANGPALSLHAKGKRPALAVDSKAKIVRLNADRLDGREAASLQNNVRVYTASSTTKAAVHAFNLPALPRGRYQATYSVYMGGALGSPTSPITGACNFQVVGANPPKYAGYTQTVSTGNIMGLSSSDVITKSARNWQLFCYSTVPWSPSLLPVRVTLTRIDKTISDSLEAANLPSTLRAPAKPGH